MTKTSRVMMAVLALCGTTAALAQSSVTVYGRVNTTIESEKLGSVSTTKMNSNGSYLGFRGVEDLGNGLKAGFVLEGGFASDTGAGYQFDRQSEINLSGNFGTLRLGRFDPASYLVTADWISMHNHDTGNSYDRLYLFNDRTTNKIAYVTPELSGFTGELQYSLGEKVGTNRGAWDLGLNYGNGPLGLGFGYSDVRSTGGASVDQAALRISYAIGDFVLGAYYQAQQAKIVGVKAKRNAYRLAAMYTLGASEFHANVGRAAKVKVNSAKIADSAATQWTLAYNYNLSKRTKAYALYTNVNNTAAEAAAVTTFPTTFSKEKFRSFGVGVRHLF